MENYDIPSYSVLSTSGSDANAVRFNTPGYLLLSPREDEYVQVDLGPGAKTVTAITLQGHIFGSYRDWISKIALNFSYDGKEFSSYVENGHTKVLDLIRCILQPLDAMIVVIISPTLLD